MAVMAPGKTLTVLLLVAAAAALAIILWRSDAPVSTVSLQLCERVRSLEFNSRETRWVELARPVKSVVVCDIPGTTQMLDIAGLRRPYVDTPLAGRTIDADCYRSARMKSGALPTQMPDGLYCNIPEVVP